MPLYRGTTKTNYKSIRKEGLNPSRTMHNMVYLADSQGPALKYTLDWQTDPGNRYLVLEVDASILDQTQLSPATVTIGTIVKSLYSYTAHIPPAALTINDRVYFLKTKPSSWIEARIHAIIQDVSHYLWQAEKGIFRLIRRKPT